MSDLLTAASESMGVPDELVERSARAWADASGSSYEDVLSAWGGGEAVASAPPATESEEPTEEAAPEADEGAAEAPVEETAPVEPAAPVQPAMPAAPAVAAVAVEPEEPVDPVPVADRIKLAGKVGAWTGAVLGVMGFLLSSAWLLPAASVAGEEGSFSPAVEVMTSRVVLAATLLSVVFGIVVATLSRTAAGWVDQGARLEGRYSVTVGLGAVLGLVLGVASGAVMVSAFSEPVEGSEGMAMMTIVPSLIVVLLGGALLGWLTAALVQLVGVPIGIDDEAVEEIKEVRERMSAAVSIPAAAVALLALLVIPLGVVFIQSNEMASGGAAALAIFAAAAILGIATLSASRPTMRISFGEFLVALAGVATVVVIVFSVFSSMAGPAEEEEGEDPTEETTETTVPEGETTETSAAPEAGRGSRLG